MLERVTAGEAFGRSSPHCARGAGSAQTLRYAPRAGARDARAPTRPTSCCVEGERLRLRAADRAARGRAGRGQLAWAKALRAGRRRLKEIVTVPDAPATPASSTSSARQPRWGRWWPCRWSAGRVTGVIVVTAAQPGSSAAATSGGWTSSAALAGLAIEDDRIYRGAGAPGAPGRGADGDWRPGRRRAGRVMLPAAGRRSGQWRSA